MPIHNHLATDALAVLLGAWAFEDNRRTQALWIAVRKGGFNPLSDPNQSQQHTESGYA